MGEAASASGIELGWRWELGAVKLHRPGSKLSQLARIMSHLLGGDTASTSATPTIRANTLVLDTVIDSDDALLS